ncbi:MAG: alpha-L-fucosidase [Bacteroidales bacterium]|nr:alpha-L-fucosidase [Bacteroidales bacterium]
MKKRLMIGMVILFLTNSLMAQDKIEPNWESIDARPVPEWFGDAKFGIFIHWGPYSVPAWSPKGTYSEWYQYWMQTKSLFGNGKFSGTEVWDYHVKTYGEDFPYYKFGDMFKADLFEPDDWANLFVKSGSKYIVVTSKHHDGYTFWQSKEANDRGFPWNSVDIGPKRDILGDLSAAVKKTDVKMGIYYSLYEWFHPWWENDKKRFVDEHFHPQFKDLITRYEPDIIWADGEWSMSAEEWKTPELLAWMFNESSVGGTIAINDRWGKGIRKKHGGYFTTEYEAGAEYDKPWEECRGMGFSFGYNRNEDVQDYNSPQTLVLMLIDIVSHGGNLLLDIGPDDRGRIPVIMQERLLQMGKWLEVNGEAIYGTTKWTSPVQWSEGNKDFKPEQHYTGGDFILKQTIDPEPGYAVKELFFTKKENDLYVISPKWTGHEIVIEGLESIHPQKVVFLATGQDVSFEKRGKNLVLKLPELYPGSLTPELEYAYVFKLSQIETK